MNTTSKLMSPILTEEEVMHLIMLITVWHGGECLPCQRIIKELKRILKRK